MNPDFPQMDVASLSPLATGRVESLFAADVASHREELSSRIRGSRILVVGGAGSIGAATVAAVAAYSPRSLHVVDHNENTLVELIRTLRSDPAGLSVPDFRCLPIDFGSTIMQRMLRETPPYDYVLNFAALKHVRSEKDVCSLLQMLDTNLVKHTKLLQLVGGKRRIETILLRFHRQGGQPRELDGRQQAGDGTCRVFLRSLSIADGRNGFGAVRQCRFFRRQSAGRFFEAIAETAAACGSASDPSILHLAGRGRANMPSGGVLCSAPPHGGAASRSVQRFARS